MKKKIKKSEFEEQYKFWELDKLQQVKVYIDYFIEEEAPDIKRYDRAAPAYKTEFKKNCNRLYNLLKERCDLNKQLLDISGKSIAHIIVYISSGISHIGLTFNDMENYIIFSTAIYRYKERLFDYFLNEINILDWYKETLEYKQWKERQQWKLEHPSYFNFVNETEEEKTKRIAKINAAKLYGNKYTQDKLLKGLR